MFQESKSILICFKEVKIKINIHIKKKDKKLKHL